MTWIWRYEGEDGAAASRPQSEAFPSQSDAESWLGEQWRELAASGVSTVTLVEGEKVAYTMPLGES